MRTATDLIKDLKKLTNPGLRLREMWLNDDLNDDQYEMIYQEIYEG